MTVGEIEPVELLGWSCGKIELDRRGVGASRILSGRLEHARLNSSYLTRYKMKKNTFRLKNLVYQREWREEGREAEKRGEEEFNDFK